MASIMGKSAGNALIAASVSAANGIACDLCEEVRDRTPVFLFPTLLPRPCASRTSSPTFRMLHSLHTPHLLIRMFVDSVITGCRDQGVHRN